MRGKSSQYCVGSVLSCCSSPCVCVCVCLSMCACVCVFAAGLLHAVANECSVLAELDPGKKVNF